MTTAQPTTATADSLRTILTDTFGDVELTGLELHDQPCFIAREIGEALGYANGGKRFASSITGRWSSDMVEGKHYAILSQQQLHMLAQLKGSTTGTFPNRGLIVLFEAGLNIALLRTSMSAGVRLRAWLAERAMPALARGRAVDAHGEVIEGSYTRPALDTNDLRQRRLTLAEARRSLAKLELKGAITGEQGAQGLREALAATMRGILSDDLLDSLGRPSAPATPTGASDDPCIVETTAIDGPVKPPPIPLKEISRRWKTPMELTVVLSMPGTYNQRKRRIGDAITGVGVERFGNRDGLRKHAIWSFTYEANRRAGESIQVDANGRAKGCEGRLYNPREVAPLLKAWLSEHKPEWLPTEPPPNLSTVRVDPEQQGQSSSSAGGASC